MHSIITEIEIFHRLNSFIRKIETNKLKMNISLEKFKNIQEQVFVFFGDVLVEVLQVIGEVDLVGDPMHLLLHLLLLLKDLALQIFRPTPVQYLGCRTQSFSDN